MDSSANGQESQAVIPTGIVQVELPEFGDESNPIMRIVKQQTGYAVPLDSVAMRKLGWLDSTGKELTPSNLVEILEEDPNIIDLSALTAENIFQLRDTSEIEQQGNDTTEKDEEQMGNIDSEISYPACSVYDDDDDEDDEQEEEEDTEESTPVTSITED